MTTERVDGGLASDGYGGDDARRGAGIGVRTVTVYCSSSSSVHGEYVRLAWSLGELIGRTGRDLVYGGGKLGLMGAVAAGCREAGGAVTGVITERLRDAEMLDDANDENVIVATMRERKQLLAERGDAFVVLPGGLGTLEEFFEILVGRLLGEHVKPIALVNSADPVDTSPYYTPLLSMFEHMANNRFMHRGVLELFDVCETVGDVESLLAAWSTGERRVSFGGDRLLPGRLGE